MYIKTDKKDPLFDVPKNDIIDNYIIEKQSTEFEFDDNNQAKYVDCFSASFTGNDFVTLYNTFGSSNDYVTSGLAYMIQSMFFPNDSMQGNNYITHPWNKSQITTVHCISLNHNLFKDKLLGFNCDILMSMTGNVFNDSFLGGASYDSSTFLYTSNTIQTINVSQFFKNTESTGTIEALDELKINYSLITGKFYYQLIPLSYYLTTGILFNDYGLILFFDNTNNWSGWNDARLINTSTDPAASGSVLNPALYLNFNNDNVSYQYEHHIMEKIINIKCDWLNCNYTSNPTIYNDDTGEYKFNVVETMEKLVTLNVHKQPRTYLSKIKLFDDNFNVVANAVISHPIKKDFLTNLNFNLKVRI